MRETVFERGIGDPHVSGSLKCPCSVSNLFLVHLIEKQVHLLEKQHFYIV